MMDSDDDFETSAPEPSWPGADEQHGIDAQAPVSAAPTGMGEAETPYASLQALFDGMPDMQLRVAEIARKTGLSDDRDPLFRFLVGMELYTRQCEAVPAAVSKAGTATAGLIRESVEQLVESTNALPAQVAASVAERTTGLVRDQLESKHIQRALLQISERFIEGITKENKSIWLRRGMAIQAVIIFLAFGLGAAAGYGIEYLVTKPQLVDAQAWATEVGQWRAYWRQVQQAQPRR